MTAVQILAGDLTASLVDRVVSGLLLPFGELGNTNLGRFTVDGPGIFKIPADVSVLNANEDHKQTEPRARFLTATETSAGIVSSFKVGENPEGDALLAKVQEGVKSGKPVALSVEVKDVVIRAGKAISGAVTGAAFVDRGAFPSAALMAADAGGDAPAAAPGEPTETTEVTTNEVTDPDGSVHKVTETTVTKSDGNTTTITVTKVIEEPDAPAPTDKETPVGAATVPNTLEAGDIHTAPRPKFDINQIANAIAELRSNPHAGEARTLLASLNDVVISGLPSGGSVLQPNWLGLLDQGDTYERQYVTLGQLGTDITAAGKKGFVVKRGTVGTPVDSYAASGTWAGNKASVFSGQGFTAAKQSVLDRFAIGEDIGREFYDLPGGAEAIIAFLALLDEDYSVWSDNTALAYWQSAAGAPIAKSSSIPAGYTGTLGMLIQGILKIKRKKADGRRDTPTFAILNDAAYEEMLYTPFEMIPEFIKFSANTDGTGTADGDVVLVNGDTGIVSTPSVLVGAKKAIQFDELSNGPLHVDALNIAQGGIDKAVHGYLQTFIVRPEAVTAIGTPDTRANTTAYTAGRLLVAGATVYRVTVSGTTGASAPSAPAINSTVADGSATLLRLA